MKLIITEEQLRLIIESKGKLLSIDFYDLPFGNDKEKRFNRFMEIYYDKREEKGWSGINVKGDLYLHNTKIKRFEGIVKVDGRLDLEDVRIKSLGDLEYVGGDTNLKYSDVRSLDKLKYVGSYLNIRYCNYLTSTGDLEYVDGDLRGMASKLTELPKLKYVGGDLELMRTPLSKTTTEEELRNKIEVKGDILI